PSNTAAAPMLAPASRRLACDPLTTCTRSYGVRALCTGAARLVAGLHAPPRVSRLGPRPLLLTPQPARGLRIPRWKATSRRSRHVGGDVLVPRDRVLDRQESVRQLSTVATRATATTCGHALAVRSLRLVIARQRAAGAAEETRGDEDRGDPVAPPAGARSS